jgi:hypothetical protein
MEYLNVTDIKTGVEYFQQDFGAKNISRESILFVSIDMEKGTATTTTSTYPIRKNKEGHWEIEDTEFGYVHPAKNGCRKKKWHALVIYAPSPPPPPSEEEIELTRQREEFNSKVIARFEEAKTGLMKTVGRELNDEEFNQLRHDVFTQILIEEQLLQKEILKRKGVPVDIATLKEEIKPKVALFVSEVNKCIQEHIPIFFGDTKVDDNIYDSMRKRCLPHVYHEMEQKEITSKGCSSSGCSIAGGRTKKSKRSKRIKKWKRSTRRHRLL